MPISVASPRKLATLAAPLRALVRETLALAGRRPGGIAVVLTDDAALRALNLRWRGLDRATDVLSFSYDETLGSDRSRPAATTHTASTVTGDVVISLDRMAEQAKRFRHSPGRELSRLVIHGTLHLCGHEHHRTGERARMRACERAALRACAAAIARLETALHPPSARVSTRRTARRAD